MTSRDAQAAALLLRADLRQLIERCELLRDLARDACDVDENAIDDINDVAARLSAIYDTLPHTFTAFASR